MPRLCSYIQQNNPVALIVIGVFLTFTPHHVSASSKGQHEITISAGLPQYCFDGLSPDALYTATVFVQTPNLEGPGVSIKERTCKCVCAEEMCIMGHVHFLAVLMLVVIIWTVVSQH